MCQKPNATSTRSVRSSQIVSYLAASGVKDRLSVRDLMQSPFLDFGLLIHENRLVHVVWLSQYVRMDITFSQYFKMCPGVAYD